MCFKNTKDSYGIVTLIFHWGVGLLILGLITIGFIMTDLPNADPSKGMYYAYHKAFGVVALALVALRVLWRLINVQPGLPTDMPKWQQTFARGNIYFLYFCMIAMPLSGFIMSTFSGRSIAMFGYFMIDPFYVNQPYAGMAHEVHMIFAWVISISIGLHVLGALYHHFVRKDNVTKRIFGIKS